MLSIITGARVLSGNESLKDWLPRQTTSMHRLTAQLVGPINAELGKIGRSP
ncbi:MAG: hypothetical protein P8O70_19220 [SAR324 cluster bacterium]|nr:hypothetical protein [SAR324 cluster bacterium]